MPMMPYTPIHFFGIIKQCDYCIFNIALKSKGYCDLNLFALKLSLLLMYISMMSVNKMKFFVIIILFAEMLCRLEYIFLVLKVFAISNTKFCWLQLQLLLVMFTFSGYDSSGQSFIGFW